MPLAPFINKETEPILMYDPLPPHDSVNIYKRPVMSNGSRLLPDASPLSMFFQSLLPEFNVQDRTFVAPEIHRAHVDQLNQAALDNLLDGAEGSLQRITRKRCAYHNIFSVFFFHFSGGAENDRAAAQPFEELRNSLNSVVDAMRDFLTNIRVPELPNDADVDENESTDDGAHDDYLT